MPIPLTVDQAADFLNVTPKTIRTWIREGGLPILRTGGKGPNQGALIDAARLPAWQREARGEGPTPAASWLKASHPDRPNPLRGIVELHHRQALAVIGLAVRSWAEDTGDHPAAPKSIGLTSSEARQAAAGLWLRAALYLSEYTFGGQFERDLAGQSEGGDLDDWLSLLTEADVRSAWQDTNVEIPTVVLELLPAETRAALTKAKRSKRTKGGADA
jgi:excisionase family DNA binding protein